MSNITGSASWTPASSSSSPPAYKPVHQKMDTATESSEMMRNANNLEPVPAASERIDRGTGTGRHDPGRVTAQNTTSTTGNYRFYPPRNTLRGKIWELLEIRTRQEESMLLLSFFAAFVGISVMIITTYFLDDMGLTAEEHDSLRQELFHLHHI
ncbi:unnamed protein product [Amoebophrya sp. A120]|nr:unnamed protein product [Amoebophrya sp. A120]|eukprot:GSA120T00021351001.1